MGNDQAQLVTESGVLLAKLSLLLVWSGLFEAQGHRPETVGSGGEMDAIGKQAEVRRAVGCAQGGGKIHPLRAAVTRELVEAGIVPGESRLPGHRTDRASRPKSKKGSFLAHLECMAITFTSAKSEGERSVGIMRWMRLNGKFAHDPGPVP